MGPGKFDIKQMYIFRVDTNSGKVDKEAKLPSDAKNLNIYKFETCHMALSGNYLALLMARTMTQSEDGLNHQACCINVLDVNSFAIIQQYRGASHSFGNSLSVRKDGRFYGIDLGDNFPRGINFWTFNEKEFKSKAVYGFKTYHGTTEKNPAGVPFPLFP